MLHTIAQQIDSLSTEIKGIHKESSPKFPLSYSAPHFQPTSLPIEYEEKIQPINLLGQITQALEKLNENTPSTSKINMIEEQNESEPESADDSDNSLVQQINQIENNIQDLEINRIHKKYKIIIIIIIPIKMTGVKAKLGIITLSQPLQIFNMKKERCSSQAMMVPQSTNGI